jgi:hypothetical protein
MRDIRWPVPRQGKARQGKAREALTRPPECAEAVDLKCLNQRDGPGGGFDGTFKVMIQREVSPVQFGEDAAKEHDPYGDV